MRRYGVWVAGVCLVFPSLLWGGSPTPFHDFAHIGDGGGIRTVFLLMNQGATDVTAGINFFADDGSPFTVTLEGTTASTFQVAVPANSVVKVATAGTDATARAGWAQLVADGEIGAQELFEISSKGQMVSQAAVESPGPLRVFRLFVEVGSGTDTGIALASLSSQGQTLVRLTLQDAAGNSVGTTDITLEPHGHLARFVSELFPGFTGRGQIEVGATSTISAVTLQLTGLVLGTLPVVRLF